MSARAALAAALACLAAAAHAQPLAKETVVRVKNPSLGAGWLEGKVGVAQNRCTMVFLKDKAPGGYTSMVLAAVTALERRDGGTWVAVDLEAALAKETKECREAAND